MNRAFEFGVSVLHDNQIVQRGVEKWRLLEQIMRRRRGMSNVAQPVALHAHALGALGLNVALAMEERLAVLALDDLLELEREEDLVVVAEFTEEAFGLAQIAVDDV